MSRKHLLLSTAIALGAAAWASSAAAQSPAPAADTGAEQIETVVITAQKRSERLQDAPVSVAVVGASQISQANATDIADLNNLVPSIQLNGSFNGRVPLGVRGISSVANEATVGLASGVAIMLDGVPVPSDSFAGNHLADIQQIEVLKGPQATLGGRTAAAGEINIVTRGPSDVFTASFSATATDRAGEHVDGFVAGPISDQLEYSLSAFADHTIYPITNKLNGDKSYQDTYGVRGKLRYQPNENLDITLMAHIQNGHSHGANFVYTYAQPGAALLGAPPLAASVMLPGITPNWSNLTYDSSVPNSGAKIHDADASLIINYQLGGLTLSSTTAYQQEWQDNTQDLFVVASQTVPAGYGPPAPAPVFDNTCFTGGSVFFFQYLTHCTAPAFYDFQTQTENIRQFTEEVKLMSPANQPFSWLIGLFYSDSVVNEDYARAFLPALVNYRMKPDTATYDVYARATWNFAHDFSLIGGVRYNYDVLKYTDNQIGFAAGGPGAFGDWGPHTSSGSNSSSALVGDASLQYHVNRDSMIYATYARGYAPKVYNTTLYLTSDASNQLSIAPQTDIDNFEIGSKGTYFDHRLGLNLALFDTQYSNFQIQTFSVIPGSTYPTLNLIPGGVETRGVELDADWQATDTLRLNVNAAYIDAWFTDNKSQPCYPENPTPSVCYLDATTGSYVENVDGKTMPNSPKFKINIGAEQRIPLDLFDLTLRADYSYRTEAQMQPDQNPRTVQPGFGLLNLGVTARSKSGTYALTVFVNNVTDHVYYSDVEDFWGAPWGSNNVVVSQPAADARRYVGVRLSADF